MGKKGKIPKNFLKNAERTPEYRKQLASNAGKISAQKRRERKHMKEVLTDLLSGICVDEDGNKMTNLEAMMISAIVKAVEGNVKAMQFVRDTIGEMPIQKTQLTGGVELQKVFITKSQTEQTDKLIDDTIE